MRFRWVQSRGCGARSAPRGIHRGEGRPDGRHGRRGRARQAPRVYFRARRGTENAPDARGDASRAPQRGDDDAVTSDAAHLHDRKVHDGLHALHSAHGNVGHRLSFRAKTTRSPKSDATPANEPKRAGRVRASARDARVPRRVARRNDGRRSVVGRGRGSARARVRSGPRPGLSPTSGGCERSDSPLNKNIRLVRHTITSRPHLPRGANCASTSVCRSARRRAPMTRRTRVVPLRRTPSHSQRAARLVA